MKRAWIIILIVVLVPSVILYFSMGEESPEDYISKIRDEREKKDIFMRENDDSPFAGSRGSFEGLKYFDPDLKYRVKAKWITIPNKKTVVLPASDGQEKKYLEYGFVEFDLDGVKNRLLVLEMTDPGPYRGTLFLAFADETSARESYGAGRYLELKKIPGASTVVVDFNLAYNPYCAYSNKYSCPFPPKENILAISIRAGERLYHP
jgi:uncharacterized protein